MASKLDEFRKRVRRKQPQKLASSVGPIKESGPIIRGSVNPRQLQPKSILAEQAQNALGAARRSAPLPTIDQNATLRTGRTIFQEPSRSAVPVEGIETIQANVIGSNRFGGRTTAEELAAEAVKEAQDRFTAAEQGDEQETLAFNRAIQAGQQLTPALETERGKALLRQQEAQEQQLSFAQALRGTAGGTRAAGERQQLQDLFQEQQRAVEQERINRQRLIFASAEGARADRMQRLAQELELSKQQRIDIAQRIDDAERQQEALLAGQEFEQSQLQQKQEFDLLKQELANAPTIKEQQQLVFDQIALAGPEFIDQLSDDAVRQIEQNSGFTSGFLRAASSNLKVNGDPNNEFTFTAPKFDEFGQLVSPGYIFDKGTGTIKTVDPQTGSERVVSGGAEAFAAFKGFDDYASKIGNGTIVKGSPYHKGFEVDIDGNIGDPITAFTGGRVVSTEESDSGYGNSVVVETPDGNRVRYAHLDSIGVREGQQIPSGAFIGGMGNTGNVIPLGGGDGSHLHIEARDKNNNLIPLDKVATYALAQGKAAPTPMLLAEAASKGYWTAQEQKTYLNSKRQGIDLPDKLNQLLPQDRLKQSIDLGNDFEKETKGIQETLINIDKLNQSLDLLKQDVADGKGYKNLNAVSQGVIIGFNKLLDPGSVVREAEYNRVGAGQSVVDQMRGTVQGWVDGGATITPENLESFVNTANSWVSSYRSNFKDKGKRYQYIADTAALDKNIIFTPNSLDLINEIEGQGDLVEQTTQILLGNNQGSIGQQDFASFFDNL